MQLRLNSQNHISTLNYLKENTKIHNICYSYHTKSRVHKISKIKQNINASYCQQFKNVVANMIKFISFLVECAIKIIILSSFRSYVSLLAMNK